MFWSLLNVLCFAVRARAAWVGGNQCAALYPLRHMGPKLFCVCAQVFGMSRDAFNKQPVWRRTEAKKRVHLF